MAESRVGLGRVSFYTSPKYWKYILTVAHVWKWLGYGSVIYLASIMSINNELYDVASIDGANAFRQIRSVTLPMLKPTIIIRLLFSVGGILRGQFELFYQMVGRNGLLYTGLIVTGPILLLYPFVQRYFVSGLTVGAVKG